MCTKNELDNILKELAQAYKSVFGDNLEKVVLYGSYARGDYDDESDVDVAGIVHGERLALQQQIKDVWHSMRDTEFEHNIILSATVIPYDEYMQYIDDLPYYMNIENEGIKISA